MAEPADSLRAASTAILEANRTLIELSGKLLDMNDDSDSCGVAVDRLNSASAEMRRLGLWLRAEADLVDKSRESD
jgi:hypothetical protein